MKVKTGIAVGFNLGARFRGWLRKLGRRPGA